MSRADAMEETITGVCALLLLAMVVVGIVIGNGPALWVLTTAQFAVSAALVVRLYQHRNDDPEED